MYNPESNPQNKKNIILSVARFETTGSKKQIEMAKAFADLVRKDEELMKDWTLILAGGTFPGNPYFDKAKRLVESLHCNIELRPDVTYEELCTLYRDAAIFWHACGLKEKDPHRVEHFGMTTVEAMQNFCVPVVIDGGGQREIVEHNVSGLRFKTVKQLQEHTKILISDLLLRQTMAEKAYNRSHNFNMDVFRAKLDEIFSEIEVELKGKPIGIQGLVRNAKQKG
jgi:glycosyltransferase involved in cell wall biosynthesis